MFKKEQEDKMNGSTTINDQNNNEDVDETSQLVFTNGNESIYHNNRSWKRSCASISAILVVVVLLVTVLAFQELENQWSTKSWILYSASSSSSALGTSPKLTAVKALEAAQETGVEIIRTSNGTLVWTGEYGGQIKPQGPLVGIRLGVILASEFSDYQVYYLASYLGELGGECTFLLVDWVTWKFVRPNTPQKGVRGMWDLSVDPMPMMAGSSKAGLWQSLRTAKAEDYNALIVVGGHSADVMVTEPDVIDFLQAAAQAGAVVGSIGEGSLPLITAGLVNGKQVTGNQGVSFMLQKIAHLMDAPVVTDRAVITARDTQDTPAFVRALCLAFEPTYQDVWKDALVGKTVMIPVGEDYEDIELIVSTMELLYRGAKVVLATFPPQFTTRPPHDSSFVLGNMGTTVPFQEIPDNLYTISRLEDIEPQNYDVAVLIGGFSPWNMVATGRTGWLKEAQKAGKLLAAICHGPVALGEADLVADKTLTGWQASNNSVSIMGGNFQPQLYASVIDGQIVTGRTPPEMPEFIDAISIALLESS